MLSTLSSNIFKGLRGAAVGGTSLERLSEVIGRSISARSGSIPPSGTYTYRLNLDPFPLDKVDVQVVNDEIVVQGKIEQKSGRDSWTHQFDLRHKMPSEVDNLSVESKIENGQLVVTAKLKDVV
ncbi:uncharacterized protein LOC128992292 [Macrosteles quadrilineatus]|uniref:uncharacterized protein LOC128992292 n=1 Tax=Macrosteles quadrilineatus TaxID=74068 RepID=UPI0023E20266|nr:uncharacterized protein LOC128992292 [Macrosteles quadrilineatus]